MNKITTAGLLTWYQDEFSETYSSSAEGGKLRYALYDNGNAHGLLVIVPGRTEFIEKYLEVAWDLKRTGYAICIYDHLGQGKSGRLLRDRDKGHIPDFSIYVEDLQRICRTLRHATSPVVLLTHSMGGTVATQICEDYPGLADGLILVSPMFQINTGRWKPPVLVESLCTLMGYLGFSEAYAWGTGPHIPGASFDSNVLTNDLSRFKRNFEFIDLEPKLALGGPTYGWLCQAYQAMREARSKNSQVSCPVLLLRGLADVVVDLPEMVQFCLQGDNRELVSYPDGRHELLMEQDEVRGAVIDKIRIFLRQFSR